MRDSKIPAAIILLREVLNTEGNNDNLSLRYVFWDWLCRPYTSVIATSSNRIIRSANDYDDAYWKLMMEPDEH